MKTICHALIISVLFVVWLWGVCLAGNLIFNDGAYILGSIVALIPLTITFASLSWGEKS